MELLKEWNSEFKWLPLLDADFSHIFEHNCKKDAQNMYTVTHKLDVFQEKETICGSFFTAIEDDLFLPKGYYIIGDSKLPIVFDSGFSFYVTLYASFIGSINKVDK